MNLSNVLGMRCIFLHESCYFLYVFTCFSTLSCLEVMNYITSLLVIVISTLALLMVVVYIILLWL